MRRIIVIDHITCGLLPWILSKGMCVRVYVCAAYIVLAQSITAVD